MPKLTAAPMTHPPLVKLPGWVRRSPELTPRLNLKRANVVREGPDRGTLGDPSNEVAYKMIGGAYGVLGAEVLGHFVPRALGIERWGIYVREAGIAWLCRELGPALADDDVGELPVRLARAVAAHHYVHSAVERSVIEAHGEAAYLDLLVKHSPRHGRLEELLADVRFHTEALFGLDRRKRRLLEGPLDALMARAKAEGGKAPQADVAEIVGLVNAEYALAMTAEDSVVGDDDASVPCYLVMEPHLPEQLASGIRRALLG